ncbi:MAG: hypothetical protein QGF09_10405, partial [Rhodospirillales bacterium]|nr:hypothetical protein [Rhodospirillales bacterium]
MVIREVRKISPTFKTPNLTGALAGFALFWPRVAPDSERRKIPAKKAIRICRTLNILKSRSKINPDILYLIHAFL